MSTIWWSDHLIYLITLSNFVYDKSLHQLQTYFNFDDVEFNLKYNLRKSQNNNNKNGLSNNKYWQL
jgi:hypothetical protein